MFNKIAAKMYIKPKYNKESNLVKANKINKNVPIKKDKMGM